MSSLVVPVLFASLAGSLHCAGMCGPFMAVAGAFGASPRTRLGSAGAYHLGRLLTYLVLGALGGVLGSVLDLAGAAAGIARVSALVAGLVLLGWGIASLLRRPGLVGLGRRGPNPLQAALARVLIALEHRPPLTRGLILGLSTTLIPCGWLYAFVAMAAASGALAPAVATMFTFWVGTLPLLLGVSFGMQAFFARIGPRVRMVSSALIAVAGLALIGLRVAAPALSDSAFSPDLSPGGPPSAECPLHGRRSP